MSSSDLSAFFEPENIAVIGSFREGFFGGYVVIKSLIRGGYEGEIYPVNPNYQEVFGIRVYPSISEVPGSVDLALVMINSRSVPEVIRECGEKAVKAVQELGVQLEDMGFPVFRDVETAVKAIGLAYKFCTF